jgi:membrane protease YdiL (CAAX protease family)
VRAYGPWRGVLLGAVAFALWHLVINFQTVRDTSVSDSVALASMAQAASMLGLILGAVFMSVLRLRTGSLAAPIAFHWLVVVAMHGTLFGLAG